MMSSVSDSILGIYKNLGFKSTGQGFKMELNINEHLSIDWGGTVYMHVGFNRHEDGGYSARCVGSFWARTPAEIEVRLAPIVKEGRISNLNLI